MLTAYLIRWVVLDSIHTISVETVPAQLCEAMSAKAVHNSTVAAAICVSDGRDIAEAVKVGACHLYPEMSSDGLTVYYCNNGRIPKW